MNILAVAEKPSVAKELASILSNNRAGSRQGRSPYNRIFECNNVEFRGQRSKMSITSVSGHLCEEDFGAEYKWGRCDPETLFSAPLMRKVKEGGNKLIEETLIAEARKNQILFLWLDCDLEGEAIGYEVMDVCCSVNPRLDVYRARFSALIPRDIFRAMQYPERPNPNMNDAVKARTEIDLRLGASFTRMFSDHLKSRYPAITSTVSYGPCQWPTLGFVFDQYDKIESFVPENFWSIYLESESPDPENSEKKLLTKFSWDRDRVFDHLVALILYETCLEHCVAKVVHVNNRPATKYRPVPLNLIELQKKASNWFRISSDETLKIAQQLYEEGVISYPRTETDFFKEGTELMQLLGEHRGHDDWGTYITKLLDEDGFQWPRHGGHDDGAHPPIHPLKAFPLNEFREERKKNIYEIIVKHFLACCSKDAVGSQTDVLVQVPEGGEGFHCKGLMIHERNYLEIYRWEKWNANKIPLFKHGDTFEPKNFIMTSGSTTAPSPLTESDLISRMDENGIGTDATIHSHITTIQTREYATKDPSGHFLPTDLGKALVEGCNNMGYKLAKPYIRAAMERDMIKVSKGELSKDEMVQNCLLSMKNCYVQCKTEITKLNSSMDRFFGATAHGGAIDPDNLSIVKRNLARCGECDSLMDIRTSSDARFQTRYVYCSTCSKLLTIPHNGEVSVTEHRCPICNFQVLSILNAQKNSTYTVCPYCFRNPPPAPYAVEENIRDFRCFQCSHPDCALAKHSPEFAPCPGCISGRLKLLNTSKDPSKLFAGCTVKECKFSWWLPSCIRSAVVLGTTRCDRCSNQSVGSVFKLKLNINLQKIILPLPPEVTVCPCCDKAWGEMRCSSLKLAKAENGRGDNAVHITNGPDDAFTMMMASGRDRTNVDRNGGGHGVGATLVNAANSSDYSAASTGEGFVPIRGGRGRGRGRGRGGRDGTLMRDNGGRSDLYMTSVEVKMCKCGEPKVLRKTQKPGVNQGREFYTCPKRQGEQCHNSFMWADG